MSYRLTEPHPSVPSSSYMYSGRGGAGNAFRAPTNPITTPAARGSVSRASFSSTSTASKSVAPARFTSGRGGAGNFHIATERAIFSFDEELELRRSREERAAPVYRIGRGGAGNWASYEPEATSARKNSHSPDGSLRSTDSRGILDRFSHTLNRRSSS